MGSLHSHPIKPGYKLSLPAFLLLLRSSAFVSDCVQSIGGLKPKVCSHKVSSMLLSFCGRSDRPRLDKASEPTIYGHRAFEHVHAYNHIYKTACNTDILCPYRAAVLLDIDWDHGGYMDRHMAAGLHPAENYGLARSFKYILTRVLPRIPHSHYKAKQRKEREIKKRIRWRREQERRKRIE
ncbi:uncharacterized protein LOC130369453 [Hyla sarda]|uniref:uncharacterized protein LOC130369453 n=1 Tax=Hyla sarda TaxID=327740 RepID=UPI0024C20FBC|nr:uncharacterized protein LOC130369453 [Hyla sarda]